MAKFDILEGFIVDKEETTMMKMKNNKERIAPEVTGARRYWYTVMAPAIKMAKKAAKMGKDWQSAKSDLVHEIRNACADRKEYLHAERYIWEIAFEEAKKAKVERERRQAAIAAANLARREAVAAEKRARQAAIAARYLEKKMTSVGRIANAIGWDVQSTTEAIKAIRKGIENALVKAYKAALKNARRERLNAASMFTAIGDLISDAQAYIMHVIGLINEDAASNSVAY